jgi:hypothetical protein
VIILKDTLSSYTFDSLGEALRRLSKWSEQGLIEERESANFIIQLFNQIPDSLYNSLQNGS